MLKVNGPLTATFRGSQPLSSSMPFTSEKVIKSPSSSPCLVSSKHVTIPCESYISENVLAESSPSHMYEECTLSIEAIIPLSAASPVVSTQVNFGPKSLKTDL